MRLLVPGVKHYAGRKPSATASVDILPDVGIGKARQESEHPTDKA